MAHDDGELLVRTLKIAEVEQAIVFHGAHLDPTTWMQRHVTDR